MPDQPLDEWLANHRLPKPRLFAAGYDARAVDDLFDNLKWGSDPRE